MKCESLRVLKFLQSNKSNVLIITILLVSPFLAGIAYGAAFPQTSKTRMLSSQVSHSFYIDPSWTICESFEVNIYLFDVQDLVAWQVELFYDPYSLVVLNVRAGEFLSSSNWVVNSSRFFYSSNSEEDFLTEDMLDEYAILVFADDVAPGLLLLGGCRFDLRSVTGSGKVATVTFGIWSQGNNDFNVRTGERLLLNADMVQTRGSVSIITNTP